MVRTRIFLTALSAATLFPLAAEQNVRFTGCGFTDFGYIVSGNYQGRQIEMQWRQRLGAIIGANANVEERLFISLQVELNADYRFPETKGDPMSRVRGWDAHIFEGYARYAFGDAEKPIVSLAAGYFPFKYNPDARNLGEYLFRTTVYPALILNFFDFAEERLAGLLAHVSLLDGTLTFDGILSNETVHPLPVLYDFSLSLLGGYKLGRILEIGAGVQFAHLISVNSKRTTPPSFAENSYFPEGSTIDPLSVTDSTIFIAEKGDYYTFRGTKTMGRIALDPKGFFDENGLLGKYFVPRLYAEAIILGFDYYPVYYDSAWHNIPLAERIPLMAGICFPLWEIMDVSFEIENFSSRYPNDFYPLVRDGFPVPPVNRGEGLYDPDNRLYKLDDFRWSLYAKKEIVKGFSIVFQAARDHRVLFDGKGVPIPVIKKPEHWHWTTRVKYQF